MLNFEEIFQKHQNLVFNLCLHYLQNRQDAEEATQDVFVKIYQKMPGFQEKSSITTWVYRITVNHCLDALRARKRQKRFASIFSFFNNKNETVHDLPDFDHPGVLLEDREALENLFRKINQLPENQRTALILKHIDDLPQRAIAEIMGLSEKAIESLLQRAKMNLKKM
jgi:RNA polymerase sigma factor (sigma-70 family)